MHFSPAVAASSGVTPPQANPRRAWCSSSICLALIAVIVWSFIGYYLSHWGTKWALDLRVYRAAGESLYHGGSPYLLTFTTSRLPFTYPPFALVVLSPLSLGSLDLVKALWWSANGIALIALLYVVVVAALRVSRREALLLAAAGGGLATLVLEPLRSNLDYGQINLLIMLLVVLDVERVKGRWRGIAVGVAAAIKLTPLTYLAYFVIDRDRRAAYRGFATFIIATALAWLILPSGSERYWFHEVFSPARTGRVGGVSNQSWNAVFHRAPFHGGALGVVLWASVSVVTFVVGVIVAKWLVELGQTIDALLVLALTELLVSPISWSHHWSWLVIVPVVLVTRWRRDHVVSVSLVVILLVAIAEPYWWSINGWLGAFLADSLTLAGAVVLVALIRATKRDLRLAHQPAKVAD